MGRIDVVIPCRNDHDTLAGVVKPFLELDKIGNIIVVHNGEENNYSYGVDYFRTGHLEIHAWNLEGKGQAVMRGLDFVESDRVIFCDADLTGLETRHVKILARPHVGMIVGYTERPERNPVPWPIPDDVWQAVSGERSLPTHIARKINLHGYAMEVQINHFIRESGLPVNFAQLVGVTGKVRENSRRMAELRRDREWLSGNGPGAWIVGEKHSSES
jgi:Glycosyl transferase family 2